MKTILILGGYGQTGLPTARLLLRHTDCHLRIAGRSLEKGEKAASRMNRAFPGDRVRACATDASDSRSLVTAFSGIDLVVVCSSTTRYCERVAGAALAAGADYLDVFYPGHVVDTLRKLESEISGAGRCFITQAGCHPGLPAAMVREAASRFSVMESADICGFMNIEVTQMTGSAAELLEEAGSEPSLVFDNGAWRKAGWKDAAKPDFGPPFGLKSTWPIFLEEMRDLPGQYGMKKASVQMGGFTTLDQWVTFPLAMALGRIRKGLGSKTLGRLMVWSGKRFGRPPWMTIFHLDARGEKDGEPVSVSVDVRHADGYFLTAAPVVACLLQYLDGSIGPGLHLQALAVDPRRMFEDLEKMGVDVKIETA